MTTRPPDVDALNAERAAQGLPAVKEARSYRSRGTKTLPSETKAAQSETATAGLPDPSSTPPMPKIAAPCGELEIQYRAPGELVSDERNARTHSAPQIAQIRQSINQFGFNNPVLIDEKLGIVAGHGRNAAALLDDPKLGPPLPFVPTIMLRGLTDEQRRAFMLADNKIALNSGWNVEMLAVELDSLRGFGFDGRELGFSSLELSGLIGTPNDAPRRHTANDEDRHTLIVECKNEAALQQLFEEMSGRGYSVKMMS